MSQSMIERVARAFVRARGAEIIAGDDHWPETVQHYREMAAKYPDYAASRSLVTDAFRDARTALIALREPTEAMKRVFSSARPESPRTVWHETIDAALAE